ncbi:MAG: helix-turn-helix domain-containing protein [Pseudonocardiaceae bacterium]|nr:helix-turn-helix domain-containing protein [Pseudonocardiaceae bacterium]
MRDPTNKLSATLRQLRKDAGLSGIEAARLAGLSQSKISRTETGTFMPTPEQVEALCRTYKASASTRRELVRMARELREDRISAKTVLERGGWYLQERIGRIEEIAGRIRDIAPAGVPGLLQTRDYVRALFGRSLSPDDLERTIAARMGRQRLLATEREFTFLLAEGALRWNMGSAAVMVDQLGRLVEESQRENVHLGVIPWTTPVTVPLLHTFTIYDSRAVLFGTQSATALITDPQEVSEYERHWSEVESFVSYGDEARAIVDRVADDYRSIT